MPKLEAAMKKVPARKVWIFKVRNRKSFAAIFEHHLCEGTTPGTAYRRVAKASRRHGYLLEEVDAERARRLVRRRP